MKGKLLPDTDVRDFFKPDLGVLRTKADTFYGSEIVRWNREDNVVEPLYDLFDYASPERAMFSFAWNAVDASCSGNATRAGVEYHHVSSVSVGSDANYIVASRELSTIWSLAHDGSGLQWALSSQAALNSTYAFERPRDRFFQPHDVLQLANGNLLVVDDGTNRPGCSVLRDRQLFLARRGVRARRRQRDGRQRDGRQRDGQRVGERARAPSKLARVVWQYEFPLQLKWSNWSDVMATLLQVRGSVYPLANGNHLVAFTALDRAARAHNVSLVRTTYAWEIDRGAAPGCRWRRMAPPRLLLPIPHDAAGTQNSYRFVPWHSIAGESATRPFRRRARPRRRVVGLVVVPPAGCGASSKSLGLHREVAPVLSSSSMRASIILSQDCFGDALYACRKHVSVVVLRLCVVVGGRDERVCTSLPSSSFIVASAGSTSARYAPTSALISLSGAVSSMRAPSSALTLRNAHMPVFRP